MKNILCWLGLICGLIGLVWVLGACGSMELGHGSGRSVLFGLALIGLGAWSVRTAVK